MGRGKRSKRWWPVPLLRRNWCWSRAPTISSPASWSRCSKRCVPGSRINSTFADGEVFLILLRLERSALFRGLRFVAFDGGFQVPLHGFAGCIRITPFDRRKNGAVLLDG